MFLFSGDALITQTTTAALLTPSPLPLGGGLGLSTLRYAMLRYAMLHATLIPKLSKTQTRAGRKPLLFVFHKPGCLRPVQAPPPPQKKNLRRSRPQRLTLTLAPPRAEQRPQGCIFIENKSLIYTLKLLHNHISQITCNLFQKLLEGQAFQISVNRTFLWHNTQDYCFKLCDSCQFVPTPIEFMLNESRVNGKK